MKQFGNILQWNISVLICWLNFKFYHTKASCILSGGGRGVYFSLLLLINVAITAHSKGRQKVNLLILIMMSKELKFKNIRPAGSEPHFIICKNWKVSWLSTRQWLHEKRQRCWVDHENTDLCRDFGRLTTARENMCEFHSCLKVTIIPLVN